MVISDEERNQAASEAISDLAGECCKIAEAICFGAGIATATGKDATGGCVGSLTEAVMGVTAGLCRIADAINSVADTLDGLIERKRN